TEVMQLEEYLAERHARSLFEEINEDLLGLTRGHCNGGGVPESNQHSLQPRDNPEALRIITLDCENAVSCRNNSSFFDRSDLDRKTTFVFVDDMFPTFAVEWFTVQHCKG